MSEIKMLSDLSELVSSFKLEFHTGNCTYEQFLSIYKYSAPGLLHDSEKHMEEIDLKSEMPDIYTVSIKVNRPIYLGTPKVWSSVDMSDTRQGPCSLWVFDHDPEVCLQKALHAARDVSDKILVSSLDKWMSVQEFESGVWYGKE